jgi:hypothetical protein
MHLHLVLWGDIHFPRKSSSVYITGDRISASVPVCDRILHSAPKQNCGLEEAMR